VERGATDEERRCQAFLPERRQRLANVARQVVVEGDRYGETPAAAASARRFQELAGGDYVVVAAKVAELPLEDLAGNGGEDLHVRITADAADAVVDEGQPSTGRGQAGKPGKEER
jgi:hypothetical protein